MNESCLLGDPAASDPDPSEADPSPTMSDLDATPTPERLPHEHDRRTAAPVSSETTPPDTKRELLDAAESLIADQGIDGASVRAITEAAGANLAAVNYHFGSKEALVKAVFERRLGPINTERLRRLDECLSSSDGAALEEIVRAFVLPPFLILDREEAPNFGRCMIRALADPGPQMKALLMRNFEEVIERFASAFASVLTDQDPEEIFWRFHFMVGSMAYTLGMGHLVEDYSRGVCSGDDLDLLGERLVRFVCAGMAAPRAS